MMNGFKEKRRINYVSQQLKSVYNVNNVRNGVV